MGCRTNYIGDGTKRVEMVVVVVVMIAAPVVIRLDTVEKDRPLAVFDMTIILMEVVVFRFDLAT